MVSQNPFMISFLLLKWMTDLVVKCSHVLNHDEDLIDILSPRLFQAIF